MTVGPGLSIIIPTRNRPERLRECLGTLAAQTAGDHEVIVVDDGSDPPLEDRLGVAADNVRFVWQPPAGLNAARNRGVAHARGDVIGFLDDDTLVAPGWADALQRAFADHGCDAAGGRVRLRLEGIAPGWLTPKLRPLLSEYDLGDVSRTVGIGEVPVGANCAATRSVLERSGGFAAGFDRQGESLLSNGDTEFFRRLHRYGAAIRYVPAAAVEHCVPASRLTRDFFQRRARAQGVSDALLDRRDGRPVTVAREWLRAGRAVPIAAKSLLAGNGVTQGRIWLDYCAGRRSELL